MSVALWIIPCLTPAPDSGGGSQLPLAGSPATRSRWSACVGGYRAGRHPTYSARIGCNPAHRYFDVSRESQHVVRLDPAGGVPTILMVAHNPEENRLY